jgi:serine/threonine protein kinase
MRMAIALTHDFADAVRQIGLLQPPELAELGELEARFPDPHILARELIQRSWLTPYQVNQLSQGKGKDLILGQYVLLERLGEGGMGQVFKARHRHLGRIVALKVVRKERLGQPTAARRFLREVEAVSKLSHPNVVRAFDSDEADGNRFFAMEYVEGIDLSRLVKEKGRCRSPRPAISSGRRPSGSSTLTSAAWSTATSSRAISWSRTAWSRSSTWAWPAWTGRKTSPCTPC